MDNKKESIHRREKERKIIVNQKKREIGQLKTMMKQKGDRIN
jgi:hypothetical protein